MKVLVIPDVHLKPTMFERASELLRTRIADRTVCLMDIADDWDQERNLRLYCETYDAAINFAKEFKDSLWCYGNHDISYYLGAWESGYSHYAVDMVKEKLGELEKVLYKEGRISYIKKIDNVLFMHGGLTDDFVKKHVKSKYYNNPDSVIKEINAMHIKEMWIDNSPIWLRPQEGGAKMYKPKKLLQVVGHTPMERISKEGNVISCDVFSTYPNGMPIGTCEYLIVDTETWEFYGVR